MKKIILSSVLLLSGFFIQAQQAPDKSALIPMVNLR